MLTSYLRTNYNSYFRAMKKLLFLVLISLPILSFSQKETVSPNPGLVHIVEKMPEYPGGTRALIKFIQTNVQYPDSAREESIQGKVYIKFVVDTTGKIKDATVIKGVHPLLDKEALRVVKAMPYWNPGMQRGKKVKVKYNLPINFSLD